VNSCNSWTNTLSLTTTSFLAPSPSKSYKICTCDWNWARLSSPLQPVSSSCLLSTRKECIKKSLTCAVKSKVTSTSTTLQSLCCKGKFQISLMLRHLMEAMRSVIKTCPPASLLRRPKHCFWMGQTRERSTFSGLSLLNANQEPRRERSSWFRCMTMWCQLPNLTRSSALSNSKTSTRKLPCSRRNWSSRHSLCPHFRKSWRATTTMESIAPSISTLWWNRKEISLESNSSLILTQMKSWRTSRTCRRQNLHNLKLFKPGNLNFSKKWTEKTIRDWKS